MQSSIKGPTETTYDTRTLYISLAWWGQKFMEGTA